MSVLLTKLQDLPVLLAQGQSLVAVEAPLTERNRILQFLLGIAQEKQ